MDQNTLQTTTYDYVTEIDKDFDLDNGDIMDLKNMISEFDKDRDDNSEFNIEYENSAMDD